MEMIDMGTKSETHDCPVGTKDEQKTHYPGFSMTGDKIPDELKDAKTGDMVRCEIIVKKTGDNIDTYKKGDPPRVEVEIYKLGYIGKGGKATKKEYLEMDDEKRNEYDKEEVGVEKEK